MAGGGCGEDFESGKRYITFEDEKNNHTNLKTPCHQTINSDDFDYHDKSLLALC